MSNTPTVAEQYGIYSEDMICIITCGIIATFVSEAISWFLIYRTDEHKKLTKEIE